MILAQGIFQVSNLKIKFIINSFYFGITTYLSAFNHRFHFSKFQTIMPIIFFQLLILILKLDHCLSGFLKVIIQFLDDFSSLIKSIWIDITLAFQILDKNSQLWVFIIFLVKLLSEGLIHLNIGSKFLIEYLNCSLKIY